MGVLEEAAVEWVYHYTPLHYLPFIARGQTLHSKPALIAAGFPERHLRTMSKAQDVARGFGAYAHLTLDAHPNILKAKLRSGFPHIQIAVPASQVDAVEFSLCRYNVAMTRYLRRDGSPGFSESPTNGYYYGDHQIPVARTAQDKAAMLQKHLSHGTMIEVLVQGSFQLTGDTRVVCFSNLDLQTAQDILVNINRHWQCHLVESPTPYHPNANYVSAVQTYIQKALADPVWRGDGLEFDKV